MLGRILVAIVYGVFAALGCLLVGIVVASIGSGPFDAVGHFLTAWAWVIGFLVALLVFLRGGRVL